ncbi:nucleotidyltransferase family protein [Beijerinckia sp. L45]|uniref:nucleotidyltransferase family protein n=1 Tax=Beijerinckia sp. L45 TaxID=1641855 RepID=UPI00131D8DFA|nr:nucleotidyltransferase domain-containing protein [Beijerinckia sp. L45]
MTRSDVIAHLKNAEPALKARGIAALFLFGSYARDEATAASDVDLLVEIDAGAKLTILEMFEAQSVIEAEMPAVEIFFVTKDNIVPEYLPSIEGSAMKIF